MNVALLIRTLLASISDAELNATVENGLLKWFFRTVAKFEGQKTSLIGIGTSVSLF